MIHAPKEVIEISNLYSTDQTFRDLNNRFRAACTSG
jgi:hypothetical protein